MSQFRKGNLVIFLSRNKILGTNLQGPTFLLTQHHSQMRNFSKEGILNSFPDPGTRVNFLNKFYQCLMSGKMPHKVRKLVVHGPKDSGTTSWINVLLGIIPMTDVASITQELQFAAAMIEEHTQLVVLDE